MKQLSMYDSAILEEHGQDDMFTYTQPVQVESQQVVAFSSDTTTVTTTKESIDDTSVTEIILSRQMANNVQCILPMLAHLNQDNRWLAWVDPPVQLLKQWQHKEGMSTDQIMVLRSDEKSSVNEIAQKALKAGTCHAVVIWSNQLSQEALDQLNDASKIGKSHGIVLRCR